MEPAYGVLLWRFTHRHAASRVALHATLLESLLELESLSRRAFTPSVSAKALPMLLPPPELSWPLGRGVKYCTKAVLPILVATEAWASLSMPSWDPSRYAADR
jgi:hypothetical protein